MELIHGTVRDLETSVHVSGYVSQGQHGGGGGVSTSHISDFQLGTRAVRLRSSQPAMIRDGDEVVVAGASKGDGQFGAKAFRNLSRGLCSPRPHPLAELLWAMLAGAFPIYLLVAAANPAIKGIDRVGFAGITFFVSALGLLALQRTAAYLHAVRVVNTWDPASGDPTPRMHSIES